MKKIILAIAALALIASPAMALDWAFYGSARVQTIYWDDDLGDGGLNPNALGVGYPVPTPFGNDSDDKGIDYDIMGTSRVGARVKGDPVQGRFEFNNGVGTRLLWGQWKINSSLRLRVGQDWRPINYFYSGQQVNDAGMAGPDGAGGAITHRDPQLKLIIGEGQNLHIAIVDGDAVAGAVVNSDVDITLPIIEANYHFAADAFFFDIGGAYWTYEVEGAGTFFSPDDDVTAYVIAGGGGFNFGPAYIKANGWYGQNVTELGQFTNGLGYDSIPIPTLGGNWKDTDSYGLLGVIGFRFTDQLAVEGGVGYENHENDTAGAKEDETMAFYAHLNYTASPGVSIIPEVGYIDYEEDPFGVDAGDRMYFSIKWQIDF